MTDAELDEAVARECFGVEAEGGEIVVEGSELNCYEGVGFQMALAGGHRWSPTTDARDAERVWDWLLEHRYVDVAWVQRRAGAATVDCIHVTGVNTEDPSWKRALCLAALEVARGS